MKRSEERGKGEGIKRDEDDEEGGAEEIYFHS